HVAGGHGHRDRRGERRGGDGRGDTGGAQRVLLLVDRVRGGDVELPQQHPAVGDGAGRQVGELVRGEVVAPLFLVEGRQHRLTQGGGVRGVVEADPQVDTRRLGAVDDVDEPDL